MIRHALLLADASPAAGLGHLARSTGLAQALADAGVLAECLALGAAGPRRVAEVEWKPAAGLEGFPDASGPGAAVVVDSYELDPGEARKLAGGAPVAAFWDDGEPPQADLLISLAKPIPAGVEGLSGSEYACLRREYWPPPPARAAGRLERVLVTAGGADPTGAGAALCEAAQRAAPGAEVTLVLGPYSPDEVPSGVKALRSPPSLRDAIASTGLVITAAGQTMLEALALGAPTVAVPVVENQRPGASLLAGAGAVRIVEPGDSASLERVLAELADDPAAREALGGRGREAVDGRGSRRVAAAISEMG